MIPENHYVEPEIDRTLDALTSRHPAFMAHERFIADRLAELAHRAYQHGWAAAVMDLTTAPDVAEQLGITRSYVIRVAKAHDIGWQTGRDRLFRPDDVQRLRAVIDSRPTRRPRSGIRETTNASS